MQHFFVTSKQVKQDTITVTGSDVNHMRRVLRLAPGEEVQVSDGNNTCYTCRIQAYEGTGQEERAILTILSAKPVEAELPSTITLFQALPKSDKMDTIIQKAVELGVAQVVPVRTNRCVKRLDAQQAEKKRSHWQAVAESAARQAARGRIPTVQPVVDLTQALTQAATLDVFLCPYELADAQGGASMDQTRQILSAIRPGQSVGILIGPEGGFEKTEVEAAVKAGAQVITLGKRILRTETAGPALMSMLMLKLEP